jgi:hypothetical protein
MTAKYYTYRNLNFGTNFSTKHHGIVINYFEYAIIKDGQFRVSDAGRERCLREQKRNVHAFIASTAEPTAVERAMLPPAHKLAEVKYNPYRANTFINTKTGNAISTARAIYLIDGRCFVDDK